MQKESKTANSLLVERLEHIKALIEETIRLAARIDSSPRSVRKSKARGPTKLWTSADVDFSTPIRPFVKEHARGMSGAKKFTLVLAHLVGGNVNKRVSLEEVQRHWNKMTAKALLGVKFNRFYSATAKENDWVNTEKNGLYHLIPSWKQIFNDEL